MDEGNKLIIEKYKEKMKDISSDSIMVIDYPGKPNTPEYIEFRKEFKKILPPGCVGIVIDSTVEDHLRPESTCWKFE